MNKEDLNLELLEQQLQSLKEQDHILEKIETTLYKMREIAEYAAANKLDPNETQKLQDKMDQLKAEVDSLETQLHPAQIIH